MENSNTTNNNSATKSVEELSSQLEIRMKNSLTPKLRKDKTLFHRFLKARDFDIDKAESMLRKHITWRKIHQVDTILQDFIPTKFFMNYPEPSLIGYDKEGSLVVYAPSGKLDSAGIMKCVTTSNYMKHWIWFGEKNIELLNKENEKTGRNQLQISIIFDLEDLTFANASSRITLDIFLRFINMYQDNFPERLKTLYLINAPVYYTICYSIFKRVMSTAMINKFQIFGSNGWKEKLLEVIDADVLPAFLGGNRTDPDGNPLCKTFITHGGEIPEHYFLRDEERYLLDPSQVKKVIVPSGKKEEIRVEVDGAGSLLQWAFFVKSKDIGFGLFCEKPELELEEVIPMQNYNTSDGAERDSHKCRSTGTYIIVFDNSHSWMSSKEVQYCVSVKKPNV